jgi:hypothetical protein
VPSQVAAIERIPSGGPNALAVYDCRTRVPFVSICRRVEAGELGRPSRVR